MAQEIEFTASDGHRFGAYAAQPQGPRKGTIIVLQEIFGVNAHIRAVCDRLALSGYTAIAPALFDRLKRGFESGYSANEVQQARGLAKDFSFAAALLDVRAVYEDRQHDGPIGVVGFCLGGSLSYHAAIELPGLAAAVGYYGAKIGDLAERPPLAPVQLHFGERDKSIPMSVVGKVKTVRPEVETHVYDAEHGFNCDMRSSYDAPSAQLAWNRTLGFFERHLPPQ